LRFHIETYEKSEETSYPDREQHNLDFSNAQMEDILQLNNFWTTHFKEKW